MLTRPGFVGAAPTLPGTSRIRLPPASPPCCDRTAAKVSHLHSSSRRLTAHEHVTEGVPIVTGKNVSNGVVDLATADRTPIAAFQDLNEKDKPRRDDILLTKDGSIGRTAIVDTDDPFCINQSVAVLWLRSCHFDRRYLQLAIDCPQTQQAVLAKTEGAAIKHISIIDFGQMVFPVPPVAEQHRVVAKVDEFMKVCDQLERALTAVQTGRTRALKAVLAEALEGPHPTRKPELVATR